MKLNEKPCTKTKKVINRRKRSKSLSKVKPVKNISKEFSRDTSRAKEDLPLHKL